MSDFLWTHFSVKDTEDSRGLFLLEIRPRCDWHILIGYFSGVITKPDLVDKGSENEIIAVVNNHRFKLKKGYTMIKCRGQQDIVDGKSLQHALEAEASFFEDHPVFGYDNLRFFLSLLGTLRKKRRSKR